MRNGGRVSIMGAAAERRGRRAKIPAKANVTEVQPQRGVSKRAVFVGLLCATAISFGESYGTLVVRGSAMAADYSTGAAIFLFFLLTLLLNPLPNCSLVRGCTAANWRPFT